MIVVGLFNLNHVYITQIGFDKCVYVTFYHTDGCVQIIRWWSYNLRQRPLRT